MGIAWDEVVARVAALDVSPDDAVIAGSGPLAAHGLVDAVGDIDLVLAGDAWHTVVADAPWKVGTYGDKVAALPGGIEACDGWFGEDPGALWSRGTTIDGWRVASLADTLAFKLRLGRAKDATHLALLRAALTDRG